MLPPRSAIGRIPTQVRPSHSHPIPKFNVHFRPFTNRTRLLLLSPAPGRPQLPFLSPLAPTRPLPPLSIHLRQHFGRLISTESREHYKRRASRGLKIGLSVWTILVLFSAIKLGVYQENIEHSWPTPPEWSWKSRWCLRSAQALQNPEQIGKLMTNWPMVAGYLRELLERLEDPEGEGKGIMEQDEGGVGRTGFDISAKSEPWRRGYFQALMGAAKAAENLDGWLTDRKQKISAPAEYVVGPSNPRPKPMPAGQKKIPREEDCEQASPSPESFYMKVLTTKGFNTGQKLDAALAYADWLDFKGLGLTAGDMYKWALDIAASGLEGDASKIVDLKTGLLKNNNGDTPSENILRVSTALAVHNARQGDLPTALSLFTSVLKSRRSIPSSSDFGMPPLSSLPSFPSTSSDPFTYLFKSLKNVLVPVEYPPPLPSGDQPPRRTTASACEEAGLMTYIGEIIYASSSKESGLAWTRDAVDMAESTLHELGNSPDRTARTRCAQCLKVGLENWKTMVQSLVTRARQEEQQSIEQAKSAWFGGERRKEEKSLDRRRWEAENAILEDRIRRLFPLLEGESGLDLVAPNSSLFA
ncbi:hypothetical protein N7535_007989 [Penicillium sp. DV-2018c]|nr:hypothetical protein N7461_004022 [Penicillium sp. DV-2018c]KAJ5566351.1 hypothetical protein N7535_007989 [Penicillium sp. DV-2018c]